MACWWRHARRPPDPAWDLWNDDPPISSSADPDVDVIVYGSVNKAGQHGCSVTLTAGRGRPWSAYHRVLLPGSTWDVVNGSRWGIDRPDGPPDTPNARMSSEGRLALH